MNRDYDSLPSFWAAEQATQGVPSARPASSAATESSASTRSWWRSSAGTTRAPAAPDGAFKRCCRATGRHDGTQGDYYVRD